MPSIGKSRRYIRARDGKDCEVRPVRRDRSDALDRCAGFRKNPAFDPDNLAGGDFDAFDVNPGSIFHFAQAGQWKRIVQPQGGPGEAPGLRARSSKPAANRFWNSCGRVRSASKPGGGSDFRFQKCCPLLEPAVGELRLRVSRSAAFAERFEQAGSEKAEGKTGRKISTYRGTARSQNRGTIPGRRTQSR